VHPIKADEPEQQPERTSSWDIPAFEGKDVAATAAKVTSVSTLEIDDRVWKVDEFVKMEIEARVVSVDHKVNERTGKLVRVHQIKAIDCRVVEWD
jgi:hypothetical protein